MKWLACMASTALVVIGAVAHAQQSASSPPPPPACEPGTTGDDGTCCLPGQRAHERSCVGVVRSCPPGRALEGTGTAALCAPRACTGGRVSIADHHCCWPGQTWDADTHACVGDVDACPAESFPDAGDGCSVPVAVATSRATGRSPDGAVWIPGGTFVFREHAVTVAGFFAGRTETSVEMYRRCVDAHVCDPALGVWSSRTHPRTPVVDVTATMAEQYCSFVGGRLPTEAEWEFAAHATDTRRYPWGDAPPTCTRAVGAGCGNGPAMVGTHPTGASPFGVQDLAGNVAEWTADHAGRLPPMPSGSFVDPVGTAEGDLRAVRGGAFDAEPEAMRVTSRRVRYATEARYDVGFRCAWSR